MGKGSNTTTTSTSPNAQAMKAYDSLLNRAGNVASTPYVPYTGDLTAGINQQQQLGIGNINQNAGFALPWIQQAGQYANAAAQPITQGQIQNYLSPYTQDVVNATTNWMNQQNAAQQESLKGNAISQGALGGDRAGVAAANLAAQQTASQAPIIAGLYNQGYGQALQTALAEQQAQAQGAYSLGSLGTAGQNAALTGAGAQLGAGGLEQQTEQARLNALYGQFQLAQAFPYSQTQWLAGIDTGVGSQMGGTSSTTAPPPNPIAQYGGLGVAGIGAFGNLAQGAGAMGGWGAMLPFLAVKDGGGIPGFADGGTTPYGTLGYIPSIGITPGRGAPPPPNAPNMGNPGLDLAKIALGLGHGNKTAGVAGHDFGSESTGYSPPGGIDMTGMGVFDPNYEMRRGGGVAGYDDGGDVDEDTRRRGLDLLRERMTAPSGKDQSRIPQSPPLIPADVPADIPKRGFAGLPRQFYDPDNGPEMPAGALGYSGDTSGPSGGLGYSPPTPSPTAAPPNAGVHFPTAEKPNVWNALMAAGLGMMASRSPFLGTAIGEGGLAGLQEYMGEKKRAQDIEMESAKLQQQAEMAQKHLQLQTQQLGETKRLHDIEAGKPVVVGTDEWGRPIYNVRDKSGNLAPVPQQQGATGAPQSGTGGPEGMIKKIANYEMPPLTGFALRTPQGQMIMSRVAEVNPDYNATFYNEANRARGAFGTGPQGNAVRSFSVGISHLDVLNEAVDALNNGDVRILNALRQRFQTELGTSTAPTSFDAIKPIVAAEITKAIAGSNMALTDRQELQAGLQKDLASMNLKDVISKYKQLMGGQLAGLERQFVTSTHGAKDFEDKLSPAAVGMLRHAREVEKNQSSAPSGGRPVGASPQRKFYQGKYYIRGPKGESILDPNQNP